MADDLFEKDDVVDILDGTPINKFGVEDEHGERELWGETGIVLYTVEDNNTATVQLADIVVVVSQSSLRAFP